MHARTSWKRLGAVAAVATATIALVVAPASGGEGETHVVGVTGEATGAWATVTDSTDTYGAGPAPVVGLAPQGGGPITGFLGSLTINTPAPTPFTGPLEVSTEGALGPDGFSTSRATVEDVNPTDAVNLLVTASAVDVECTADVDGVSGSTTITDGVSFLPDDPTLIPEEPAPNTVVWSGVIEGPFGAGTLRLTGEIVVNEQVTSEGSIRVVGLRSELLAEYVPEGDDPVLLFDVETLVGDVSCGVDTAQESPVPPEPPTPSDRSEAAEAVAAAPRFTG